MLTLYELTKRHHRRRSQTVRSATGQLGSGVFIEVTRVLKALDGARLDGA